MPEGSERQGDTTKWYFISAWPQEFLNLQMYLWRKILMQQQPSTFSVVAGASSVVSWPPDGLLYCWHAHMPSQRDLWAVDHMVRMEPIKGSWLGTAMTPNSAQISRHPLVICQKLSTTTAYPCLPIPSEELIYRTPLNTAALPQVQKAL